MSMIRVENLTFAYPGSYDHVFENVSFQFDTAWKLGFLGRNGESTPAAVRSPACRPAPIFHTRWGIRPV